MSNITKEEVIEWLSGQSVLEIAGLVKDLEAKWGVSAAAPVVVAAAPVAAAAAPVEEKTEFNVVMGLCVGHDSLFLKYATAPCTVFAVKDRLLGHNPLAAIYNIDSYYRSLKIPAPKE